MKSVFYNLLKVMGKNKQESSMSSSELDSDEEFEDRGIPGVSTKPSKAK